MQKDKPVHEIRLGAIKAAIWKNETPGGGVRYTTHLSRIYRDEKDKEWKRSETFGRDDLLVVAKVADEAHTWIHSQTREDRERDRERAGVDRERDEEGDRGRERERERDRARDDEAGRRPGGGR